MFDVALIDELLSKSPLLRVSRTKKVEKKKRRILTFEEEIKLLETAKNWKRNKQAYNILFTEYGSGLRRSEVMPLKKSDINFVSRELTINRVYVMVKGVPKLEERAKSEASQEPLIIPEILANHLAAIKTDALQTITYSRPKTATQLIPTVSGVLSNAF